MKRYTLLHHSPTMLKTDDGDWVRWVDVEKMQTQNIYFKKLLNRCYEFIFRSVDCVYGWQMGPGSEILNEIKNIS